MMPGGPWFPTVRPWISSLLPPVADILINSFGECSEPASVSPDLIYTLCFELTDNLSLVVLEGVMGPLTLNNDVIVRAGKG